MPPIENIYLLLNETDVVRVSEQHLGYLVNMLLPYRFQNVLKVEVTQKHDCHFNIR